MIRVISLAQYAMMHTRSWAVNGPIARVRLKAANDMLRQHVALLTEEIRIKNARVKWVAPHKRPHSGPKTLPITGREFDGGLVCLKS